MMDADQIQSDLVYAMQALLDAGTAIDLKVLSPGLAAMILSHSGELDRETALYNKRLFLELFEQAYAIYYPPETFH